MNGRLGALQEVRLQFVARQFEDFNSSGVIAALPLHVDVASGVGACLEGAALRKATAPHFAELAARLRIDPDRARESGGEDYVLLFTLPKTTSPPRRFRALAIGAITRQGDKIVCNCEELAQIAEQG